MTYAAFFPILLGTVAGVRAVDRAARRRGAHDGRAAARRSSRASCCRRRCRRCWSRCGSASRPSWTAVVAAELIGAPSGLGYAIEWYRELLMTPQVMAFIAMIGVLGYLTDRTVRALAQPLHAVGAGDGGVAMTRRPAAPRRSGLALPVALLPASGRSWGMAPRRVRACRCRRRSSWPRVAMIANGDLPLAILQSLGRVFGGFAVAALLAIPLGLAMGHSRARSSATSIRWSRASGRSPRSRSCRWRSSGSAPARRAAVMIVAYAAFFPIVINTVAGAKRVNPTLLQAAATMGLSRVDDASARSLVPAALPVDRRRPAHRAWAWPGRRSSPPSSRWAPRPAAAARAASAR